MINAVSPDFVGIPMTDKMMKKLAEELAYISCFYNLINFKKTEKNNKYFFESIIEKTNK